MSPDIVFDPNRGLPMGCHAFCKNIPFWEKIVKFPEDVKDAAYKEHGEFMKIYYDKRK